jgi:HK97 family phage major capsid protein
VYRPGNLFGGGDLVPQFAGVAHYSALALLQERDTKLKAREDALVAAAESAEDPAKALEALAASADERQVIGTEREQLSMQIAGEIRRRDRETNAPAAAVSEGELVEAAAEAAEKVEAQSPKPFKTLGDQLKAVHSAAIAKQNGGTVDPRLLAIQEFQRSQAAIHGASETVGSDGGFLVQTDFNNELLGEIIAAGNLASLTTSREIGANSNSVKFNVFKETSRATGSRYGGVRAYWLAEGGQKTASRPKMDQIEITLQKMAAMYVATDELLQDTTALESFVRPAFVEEMAFVLDDSLIRGTGAGMPLGILNSDALVTVSKETGQAADTVVLENIDKMLVRILPGSFPKATWYINQELFPQLWNLAQIIGVGGVPAFIPPGGAGASPYGTLRGRPVVPIAYASAPGDLGDIFLADWKQYILVRKGGIQQASSIHVYFDTDETAFRWVLRVNGRPWRSWSVTPYKGSGTLSPFVTLQAR